MAKIDILFGRSRSSSSSFLTRGNPMLFICEVRKTKSELYCSEWREKVFKLGFFSRYLSECFCAPTNSIALTPNGAEWRRYVRKTLASSTAIIIKRTRLSSLFLSLLCDWTYNSIGIGKGYVCGERGRRRVRPLRKNTRQFDFEISHHSLRPRTSTLKDGWNPISLHCLPKALGHASI